MEMVSKWPREAVSNRLVIPRWMARDLTSFRLNHLVAVSWVLLGDRLYL